MSGQSSLDSIAVARAVKAAVEAVPGVAAISAGRYARIGTYGPESIVRGIAVSQIRGKISFEVHIIAFSSAASLPALAESVRDAARETARIQGVGSVHQINVVIEDLRDEEALR